MKRTLKLSEAKATFSAVVEGVANRGESYIIERHGKPVAAVVSIENFERIGVPTAEEPLGALALLGAWADVPDEVIDKFLEDVYRARAEPGRPVDLSE